MSTNSDYKVYRGPYILSVGIPIVVTAISTPRSGSRVLERYILIYSHENVVIQKGTVWYLSEDLPPEFISNEALLESELEATRAQLENWIWENKKEIIGTYFQPLFYKFEETESSALTQLYIFRGFNKILSDIAHRSDCTKLKDFLNKLNMIAQASFEDLPLTSEN